jgi:6-phosphogluconolactonase
MKPRIHIFKNLEEISVRAAEIFIEQAAVAIRERGRFLAALNGGGTPERMFQLFGTDLREQVDWSNVHVFWGDERSVPSNDPGSSYGQARNLFLRHVPIPEGNIHPIPGDLRPAEAAQEYSKVLKKFADPPFEWPRFDLVYLGMGEDGHTASLFPGSPLDDSEPVVGVTAHYRDRPAERVTLTPLVFNTARMVVFMAAGEKKAVTIAQVLSGRYNPEQYPAQRIEPKEGRLLWLVDEDAASRLPLDLVRRFCEG